MDNTTLLDILKEEFQKAENDGKWEGHYCNAYNRISDKIMKGNPIPDDVRRLSDEGIASIEEKIRHDDRTTVMDIAAYNSRINTELLLRILERM